MKKGVYRAAALILAVMIGGLLMFGCGAKRYKVEYDFKDSYKEAKDFYKAGETVTVYYYMIATDTDYSFYLDDERINPDYEEEKGFIISFTMPEHDVKLRCESRNSMVYVPEIEVGTLLVDYFKETVATVGGDGYFEMTLSYYDPVQAKLDVYEKNDGDEEESCVSYLVPYEAVEKCMDVMYEEDLASWEGRDDLAGITGARYVLKFRLDDGDYLRVTSENMPQDDGMRAFDKVRYYLTEYIKDEYLIDENR